MMKRLNFFYAILVIIILPISNVGATNYTFTGTGEWDDTAKWDTYPSTTIAPGDTVFIQGECTIAFGTAIDNDGVIVIVEEYNLICSGSIDSNGYIIVDGELFNDNSVINRNTLIINGSLFNEDTSQLINTQNSIIDVNGSVTNNSSLIQYSGFAKFNGNIVNNEHMSILGIIERKSSASGIFLNNDYININANATFESTVQNSTGAVIIINGSSLTIFSDDADFLNEGELRIAGTLHVGSGHFNSESLVKVNTNGILRKKKSILSIL